MHVLQSQDVYLVQVLPVTDSLSQHLLCCDTPDTENVYQLSLGDIHGHLLELGWVEQHVTNILQVDAFSMVIRLTVMILSFPIILPRV